MKRIVFLWNQSNTFGLSQDATLIEHAIMEENKDNYEIEFVRLDPLQPPSNADIVIHLEIPHPVWLPWAPVHIWMVNPEWCSPAWLPYAERFTQVWVKELSRLEDFGPNASYVPWAVKGPLKPVKPEALGLRQALWVLGASQNKHAAARALLPLWPTNFPLTVTTTLEEADLSGSSAYPPSVTVKRGFLEARDLEDLNRTSAIHVCISAAEGFGFTAAQAEARSAGLLLNTLPVYEEYYKGRPYASFLQTPTAKSNKDHLGFVADFSAVTTDDLKAALQVVPYGEEQVQGSEARLADFVRIAGRRIVKFLNKTTAGVCKMPPTIAADDCPPISVLTLTYNRRNFIDLAFINMLVTDYPKSKIQWVIVEDSDDPNEDASDRVVQVGMQSAPLQLIYCPIGNKTPIAEKRNMGVARASNNIILFMDDDDHYPETSFRRRVAWLTKHPWQPRAVACTTIACYDLIRGVSAVNTPPFALGFSKRISEATLAFYKEFWTERNFNAADSIGEGEFFLQGRESQCLELPPQQMIVAFSHRKNTSGRRIPSDDAKPGCFWAFPREYLQYIHELAGVTVEEDAE